MGKRSTQEEVITEFIKRHGNRYGYEKVDYKGWNVKVIITCKIHGEFEQIPNSHLNGNGCPKCGDILKGDKLRSGKEEFIKKAIKRHGNKNEYGKVDYKGNGVKVIIICKIHGEYKQTPASHLRDHGCPICGRLSQALNNTFTKEEFIKEANKKHGEDKNDYKDINYVKRRTKIKIRCKKEGHGEYEQLPSKHLQGQGCPKCRKESVSFWLGGYRETGNLKDIEAMSDEAKNKKCSFYHFRVTGKEGIFYKIGISVKTKLRRQTIENESKKEYKVEVLYEWKETLYESLKREIELKEKYQQFRYWPKIKFSGRTECFFVNVLDIDFKEGWTMMN